MLLVQEMHLDSRMLRYLYQNTRHTHTEEEKDVCSVRQNMEKAHSLSKTEGLKKERQTVKSFVRHTAGVKPKPEEFLLALLTAVL